MIKTLAKQLVPTRQDIKKRFDKRLRGLSDLYTPITSLLSEETEKLIMEIWIKNDAIEPEPTPFIELHRQSIKSRWYCRNCGNQNIHAKHNYCPKCGIYIKWTSPK